MKVNWAKNEFDTAELGDERLKERVISMAERFSDSPESSINHACDDWAETKAAYRFFQNETVNYKDITASHSEATKKRCADYATVLSVQDTTYFTYSSHPGTQGLCPLSRNRGKNKKAIYTAGLIMHSALAVTTDGLTLGIIDQKIYSRPPLSEEEKQLKRTSHNNALPVEEKDSYRWIEALANTCALFKDESVRVVTIADREADMYELFQRAEQSKAAILIRANHDRTVNKKSMCSEKTGQPLWSLLQEKEVAARITVEIPKQKDKPARSANCTVAFAPFTMHPSRNLIDVHAKECGPLSLYAVHVKESNPPSDVEPIEWMLITNIAVTSAADALEKVKWYCLRWRIEVLHKVLKSGLQVEECRLSTAERLIRYLAVMSVVAWRIFWLTLIARITPNAPCDIFLSESEWKILLSKVNPGKRIPRRTPTIGKCVRWIAQLGGFLARKSDKDPGITHIWRGLRKFTAILEGAEIAARLVGNR